MTSNHYGAPTKAQHERIGMLVTARDAELDAKNHRYLLRTGSDPVERFTLDHNIAARVLHLLFDPDPSETFPSMDHWQVRLYRDHHTFDTTFHTGRATPRVTDDLRRTAPLPTPGCVLESLLTDIRVVEQYQGSPRPWRDMAEDFGMEHEGREALRTWELMVDTKERMVEFLGEHMGAAMTMMEDV